MAIIFNSITQFQIQPERTKIRVKRDELDTLAEVWVGPSANEDSFVPKFGTTHLSYNLMTLFNSSIKRLAGSVSEVTLTYQGKLANGSSTGYTSVPTINKLWMEGEVTYQVNSAAGYTVYAPGIGYETTVQNGVASFSRRYTGRCVELSYITNRIPTGNATMLGTAKEFLGFLNIWDVMSGFSAGVQISGGGMPFEQMVCTDVKVTDRAIGWYQVTETYQSRMFPGAVGVPISQVQGQGGNTLGFRKGSTQADNQQAAQGSGVSFDSAGYAYDQNLYQKQYTENVEATQAYEAAQGVANYQSVTLPQSGAGSVGASTTQQTGIDPAWGSVSGATSAASDSASSAAGDLQTSYESTFLDY